MRITLAHPVASAVDRSIREFAKQSELPTVLPHSEMLPGITAVQLTDNSGLAISDLRQFADVFVWCRIEIDLELIPEILSGGGGERWQAAVRAVDGFPSLGARLSKGVMLLFCS